MTSAFYLNFRQSTRKLQISNSILGGRGVYERMSYTNAFQTIFRTEFQITQINISNAYLNCY